MDYETQPTWQLVTLVRDGGGFETRCHLVVEVEDANEAAPVFQQPTDEDLELLINSDEPEGTYLMTVIAIDPDFNPENSNGAMHYSLAGENEIIQIDSSSGEVFLNTSASSIVDEGKTFRVIITVCFHNIPFLLLKESLIPVSTFCCFISEISKMEHYLQNTKIKHSSENLSILKCSLHAVNERNKKNMPPFIIIRKSRKMFEGDTK